MGLFQEYGTREHSASGSTFSTDLHGKVGEVVKIDEVGDEVEIKGVKVLGSVFEVGFGQPDGTLPKITLMLRLSGVFDFEDVIRAKASVPDGVPVSTAGVPLACTLTSEPLDGNEDALPTVVRSFNVIYLGSKHGADRGSNDAIQATISLQLTTPAILE